MKVATQRQKRVARKLIENAISDNPITHGEIVESSGYGISMKKNPQVIINSQGVQEELKNLGFHEDNAKKVVGEILDDLTVEPQHRLKAAEQVFKVSGSYAAEKHVNVTLQISAEERDKILGISTKVREQMTHAEING